MAEITISRLDSFRRTVLVVDSQVRSLRLRILHLSVSFMFLLEEPRAEE